MSLCKNCLPRRITPDAADTKRSSRSQLSLSPDKSDYRTLRYFSGLCVNQDLTGGSRGKPIASAHDLAQNHRNGTEEHLEAGSRHSGASGLYLCGHRQRD